MKIANASLRIVDYYQRYGFVATLRRVRIAFARSVFAPKMVVFYCDLNEKHLPKTKLPESVKVKRVTELKELSRDDLQRIVAVWNPKLANQKIVERFDNGATLWLIEFQDRLAGYGWTMRGRTIAEYYFPMGPSDVQLFDFLVFPEFRGRALHWFLTGYILTALASEGGARAYADTHEWNQAQLASFKMTPFRPLGTVRTYQFFGQHLMSWVTPKEERKTLQSAPRKEESLDARRSNA